MHSYEFLSDSKETVVLAMLTEYTHWLDSDTFFRTKNASVLMPWLIPVLDLLGFGGEG